MPKLSMQVAEAVSPSPLGEGFREEVMPLPRNFFAVKMTDFG